MRLPLTLSYYIARHFFFAFLIALTVILVVIGLIELVELIRRASHKEYSVPFHIILEMTLLKIPHTAEKILPFGVLIGSMVSLSKLAKSSELVVVRASGVSVWQFLMPQLISAVLIGFFFAAVFNPISSAMISRYEKLEGKYITNRPSILSVSPSGLWLRQVETLDVTFNKKRIEEYIIQARRISQSDMSLSQVIIFVFGEDSKFIGRIDAPMAKLETGYWKISSPTMSSPGLTPVRRDVYHLETELSINQIKESFASPKTLSFWELPGFIQALEKAGFSALRHKLHWNTLLSMPVMLSAMVLIASIFSLRHHRRGGVAVLITAGIISGFLVYFVSNLVYALGFSGSLPVGLAAWTPPMVAIMVATTLLLHFEDG
ncbi:MAG: LPS export ABC transporter permease LptG [Rickettsiales bacterium]|nr:LPS export ABC transporter permease LptG [Rickettsiales bacterium]